MPQANIETSFICFELKPFHNKNQFKDIIVNLGREFNQDSIIINSPKDKRGAVFTLICTTPYPYLMLDGEKTRLGEPFAELKDPKFRNSIADEALPNGQSNPDFLIAFTEFMRKIKADGKTSRFGFGGYKALSQGNTANSVLAKLKANLIENGQRKIRGTRGGWENWSKWVPGYSYDSNAFFTMDSVLDNTYKPKSLKDNQFDTNAGYCSINEQDLLNQFINVSAKLSHDTLLAIRQTENIDLVYALIKDTTYNSLNKRYDFIFEVDKAVKRSII
ncbi:hypothetical protein ACRBC4_05110 [Helicobacter pylori]|uniref:hypothetical protein n=1 Tax=Helicobacter pylori TaxID=210 RepID=UPI003D69F250